MEVRQKNTRRNIHPTVDQKANIIKDHVQNSHSKLTIVTNIGPTMATF